jgi:hypothetical protein
MAMLKSSGTLYFWNKQYTHFRIKESFNTQHVYLQKSNDGSNI